MQSALIYYCVYVYKLTRIREVHLQSGDFEGHASPAESSQDMQIHNFQAFQISILLTQARQVQEER